MTLIISSFYLDILEDQLLVKLYRAKERPNAENACNNFNSSSLRYISA